MRNKIDPCHYSGKIIFRYLKRFLQERKGVLCSTDIEFVHRMRVASRRLRAALTVFKGILPVKKVKIWRKEISKIGRALGLARQLDVQIKFLEAAKNRLKNDSAIANTKIIIKSLERKRRQAQKQNNLALGGFEIKNKLPGLKICLKELSSGRRRRLNTDAFNAQRRAIILKRLDKLLEFAPYVSKPKSMKELHRMRIAAKKLRYALEIFRPWYGAKIDKYIRASRDIQDILGDLHEFDVLMKVLPKFSRKRGKGFNDTVAYVTQECAKLRLDAYLKFTRIWRDLQKEQLWVRLKKEI